MTLNQKLAAGAFVLGAIAVFAEPMRGGVVSVDTAALAGEMQRGTDRITPLDLADWIVQGRADFRLIDVRGAEAFAAYHIPGAEHVPVGALSEPSLLRNEKIVVYADEGSRAAQAWFLLKARGYPGVYLLEDGLDGWQRDVLFPTLVEHPTPYQAQRNDRLANLAKHFGGQARAGGGPEGASSAPAVMPNLPTLPPAPAGVAPGAVAKKKKKEGC